MKNKTKIKIKIKTTWRLRPPYNLIIVLSTLGFKILKAADKKYLENPFQPRGGIKVLPKNLVVIVCIYQWYG